MTTESTPPTHQERLDRLKPVAPMFVVLWYLAYKGTLPWWFVLAMHYVLYIG